MEWWVYSDWHKVGWAQPPYSHFGWSRSLPADASQEKKQKGKRTKSEWPDDTQVPVEQNPLAVTGNPVVVGILGSALSCILTNQNRRERVEQEAIDRTYLKRGHRHNRKIFLYLKETNMGFLGHSSSQYMNQTKQAIVALKLKPRHRECIHHKASPTKDIVTTKKVMYL